MAVADLSTLIELIKNAQMVAVVKEVSVGPNGTLDAMPFSSQWTMAGTPGAGATPSTAAAVSSSTPGAIPFTPAGAGRLTLVGAVISNPEPTSSAGLASPPPAAMVIDRLSHQGGLVGDSASTQTTNLPTVALTRYTSGVGVMVALETYSNHGSSASVATVSYTNQAGTSGRSGTVVFPLTSRATGDVRIMSLASGDSGVRSVESVTLSGSMGSAGNFGVTLFKPLFAITGSVSDDRFVGPEGIIGMGEEILDDACLQVWPHMVHTRTNTSLVDSLALYFAEV